MTLFGWLRRTRLDDLSDEIQSHIEEKTDELVGQGMSRADAERAARRAFGDVTRVKERAGDVWRLESFLGNLAFDVRHALRGLIHKPGYTIAVILTLALGIGANAVVFALVNAVVLRPLPYPDPDRIISISVRSRDGRDTRIMDDIYYVDWSPTTRTVLLQAAYGGEQGVFQTSNGPVRLTGISTAPAYFAIFGVRPLLGRLFDESEMKTGGPQAIVLSEPLWRERFGADSALIGGTVQLNGKPRTVIGILPAKFTEGREERFWIPHYIKEPDRRPDAEWDGYGVVARLRPGVSFAAVEAEVAVTMARLEQDGSRPNPGTPVVMTLHERRHGETRRPLLLLFGAVGVLLLTACANIANLALARAARREREFAVRLALGASRWRIIRFVLIENLALAAGGALVGLLLVRASLGWFVHVSPDAIRTTETIGVSGALVLYASVIAILTALLFGLVPAVTASRTAPNHTLASGTQQVAGSRRHSFARRALVIGELAIALVFLTGAGLVGKTFWQVMRVDPGFQADHVLIARMELGDRYTAATAEAFWATLIARIRQHPGVRSAALTQGAPMTGGGSSISGEFRPQAGRSVARQYRHATVEPEYFETVEAELVAGRFLAPEDRKGAPLVAVVSEGYSAMWLDGASALGRTIRKYNCRGNNDCDPYDVTIVGVVKEMVQEAAVAEKEGKIPLVFTPMAQIVHQHWMRKQFTRHASLLVRANELAPIQALVRDEVKALDATQPEPSFSSMERALDERVAPRKFVLVLLVAFAALACSLAIIGLYSVLAYLVAEQTREFGIRIAVGAEPGRVTRMVLGHGLRFTIVGLVIGGAISIAAVRVLRSWMYEMSVYDAPTFTAVAVLLCLVALSASWLPARRASRVDPIMALRTD
jgi:putative ABC transport system permease protein